MLPVNGNVAKMAMKEIGLDPRIHETLWTSKYKKIVSRAIDQKRSNVDQEMKKVYQSKFQKKDCRKKNVHQTFC